MSIVRWTARATADLVAIGDYVARDKPKAARAWVERLRKRVTQISVAPHAGRVVPELGRIGTREVFVRTYRIVYRLVPDGIVVLTVFQGSRLLENDDLNPDE